MIERCKCSLRSNAGRRHSKTTTNSTRSTAQNGYHQHLGVYIAECKRLDRRRRRFRS